MNQFPHSPRHPLNRQSGLLAFLPFLLLVSCAAAPFLIPAGIEFARNLLVTSNKNYGGKYSEDMNRLMVRLSTPYVAMGLPMGTSPAALVPPAMLQQQQQAMMNQMGGQQYGQGMAGQYGMGGYGGYVDQYNPTGAVPGAGYPPGGYGEEQSRTRRDALISEAPDKGSQPYPGDRRPASSTPHHATTPDGFVLLPIVVSAKARPARCASGD